MRLPVLLLLVAVAALGAADHPRLFVSAADLPALRARIQKEPWKAMVERLRADLDKGQRGGDDEAAGADTYDTAVIASRAAFLYLLSGDEAMAAKAKGLVATMIADRKWADPKLKGLTSYFVGARVAFAYDWCWTAKAWDEAFRGEVSRKLKAMGDMIVTKGGAEQNRDTASNWQGNRFAAGGLCLLATDEAGADTARCYDRVRAYLLDNLGNERTSMGWNIEGLGYTYYPMGNFVGPYLIAQRRADPARDLSTLPSVQRTFWSCSAALSLARRTVRPDFGDDNPGTDGEGCFGQAFAICPKEWHGALAWWYARTWGAKGDRSWDDGRAGTIWSILWHPGDAAPEQDPMTVAAWRAGFDDRGGNGMFTFRDAYRDADDCVAQLYVKLRGNRGHSGPDALGLRLIAAGAPFVVGGGRYGPKHNGMDAYLRSQSSPYPGDPDGAFAVSGDKGALVGEPLFRPDGSGALTARIAKSNVGVSDWTRRFLADHADATGAAAAYVLCDSTADGRFWQLCTLDTHRIERAADGFTITAENGATLKATVLWPKSPVIATGTRPRGSNYQERTANGFVHVQTPDGNALVVLTVQPKGAKHPAVTAQGTWSGAPAGTVTVGGVSIAVTADRIGWAK